jgi:hypothetical protein
MWFAAERIKAVSVCRQDAGKTASAGKIGEYHQL